APGADDKLSLKGEAVLPPSPPLDPLSHGVRLLLTGAGGTIVLDVTIPGGTYDAGAKTGWKVNGGHTTWTYKGPGTTTQGIQKVGVKRTGAATPNGIKFSVTGKNGTYGVTAADVPVTATLVLDVPVASGGQCAVVSFPAAPPAKPSCVLAAGGATLK